jgi:hypothetical protein
MKVQLEPGNAFALLAERFAALPIRERAFRGLLVSFCDLEDKDRDSQHSGINN